MIGIRLTRGRRRACAVALVASLPTAAFFTAPAARAEPAGPPGSDLAGLSGSATATGAQVAPLLTGVVPAGDIGTGNFFQISFPYSASASSTGPNNGTTAAPVWPGGVAAGLGNAFEEFGAPASFANNLNDHELAEAAYPPSPTAGASSTYSAAPSAGVGTSTATAQASGTIGNAVMNDTSFGDPSTGVTIEIGSSTASTSTTVGAATVSDTAVTHVSQITIPVPHLPASDGIDIASVSSYAETSSNGTTASEGSSEKVGAVTVAGVPAYIGTNGLELANQSAGAVAIALANTALGELQAAKVTVRTIAPTSQQQGNSAAVSSGGVQVAFDTAIPGAPAGASSGGYEVDLGLSQASAQATLLPTIPIIPAVVAPPSATATPTSPATVMPAPAITTRVSTSAPVPTGTAAPAAISSPTVTTPAAVQTQTTLPATTQRAVFGIPLRLAWVVLALMLSIVLTGPLLGYANWQLLRGRKT